MNAKQAIVFAAYTQEQVKDNQCVVVETFDTVKEAKHRARYVLSGDFAKSGELPSGLGYSAVMVNGECVADYFAK